ncbi:AzlC family ABC transporter permease [Nocardioides sp. TRM66260-LWL]|uniref:AzlC family ABC transporter permease n=1 Tax=Nocardioides sp. TRM66260-LWL TaxID=2874478 RepID=UPI001CC74906|nr:AzlC family ABC transporter permease [Nocardioides sp. TRM66260-LWL]MBZ5734346.1 AzlC family ABC transporter permease [Nocardioides sp. TRM66260-LWL]
MPLVESDAATPPAGRRRVIADSLGVGLATGAYGVSFGAVATASGLGVAQACVLSLLMFTGASQFALVGVLAGGGSVPAATGTALLLGVRNSLYGLRLASLLGWRGWRRLGAAHLVIDESTAMATAQPDRARARLAFVVTGGSVFVLWNLSTLLGAVAGSALGDPRTLGLDAAVGAAFLALLWPRLTTGGLRALALVAAVLALALVPLTPAGVPVLAAGGLALLVGLHPRWDPAPPQPGTPR